MTDLATIPTLRRQLDAARTLPETRAVMVKAAALREIVSSLKSMTEEINQVIEIQIRAQRSAGQLALVEVSNGSTVIILAEQIEVHRTTLHNWMAIARIPDTLFEENLADRIIKNILLSADLFVHIGRRFGATAADGDPVTDDPHYRTLTPKCCTNCSRLYRANDDSDYLICGVPGIRYYEPDFGYRTSYAIWTHICDRYEEE